MDNEISLNQENLDLDYQKKIQTMLELDQSIPDKVLLAAISNPNYAQELLLTRGKKKYQNYLLENPPPLNKEEFGTMSDTELIKSAAKSLLRWAKTGFSTVDEETFQARISACESCPNLHVPSEKKSGFISSIVNKNKVCGKCGCPINSKAKLSTEHCPDINPENSELTRWGEAIDTR